MENKLTLRCEVCGREIGPARLTCHHRGTAHAVDPCPYTAERRRIIPPAAAVSALLLGVLLLAGIAAALLPGPNYSVALALLMLAAGGFLAGFGVYHLAVWETTLHNPETGALWQQQTIFGWQSVLHIREARRAIAAEFTLPQALPLPASTGALYAAWPGEATVSTPQDDDFDVTMLAGCLGDAAVRFTQKRGWHKAYHIKATYVITTTLMALIAADVVVLNTARRYDTNLLDLLPLRREPTRMLYLVTPGPRFGEIDGDLENRMQVCLQRCLEKSTRSETTTPALTVYELVRGMFKHNVDRPFANVIDTVAQDAAQRDLLVEPPHDQHIRFDTDNPDLRPAADAVRHACRAFRAAHPTLTEALFAEVHRALASRQG